MGRLIVDISDELDKEFRKKVIDVFNAEKGAIRKAVTEAIKLWLKAHS